MAQYASYSDMLTDIDNAIRSILEGDAQSFTWGKKTVTKANIEVLLNIRPKIAALAARESRGGILVQNIVPKR